VSAHEVTQETHTMVYVHLIVLSVSVMVTALLMRNVCSQVNVSAHHPSSLIKWMAINAKVCTEYINIITAIYRIQLFSSLHLHKPKSKYCHCHLLYIFLALKGQNVHMVLLFYYNNYFDMEVQFVFFVWHMACQIHSSYAY